MLVFAREIAFNHIIRRLVNSAGPFAAAGLTTKSQEVDQATALRHSSSQRTILKTIPCCFAYWFYNSFNFFTL